MEVSIALGNQGPAIPITSSSIVAAAPHPLVRSHHCPVPGTLAEFLLLGNGIWFVLSQNCHAGPLLGFMFVTTWPSSLKSFILWAFWSCVRCTDGPFGIHLLAVEQRKRYLGMFAEKIKQDQQGPVLEEEAAETYGRDQLPKLITEPWGGQGRRAR